MSMPVVPIEKNRSCPPGYRSSGNMCIPNSNAKPVIAKIGSSCPPGWRPTGNYCVANDSNPKP